ncbi:MAG: AAA family ATPase [Candidatus Bathyarchaeota archaeon]|nr:MAG: AAA family ATPase [Candidatus Bathyarchaeota archaeon]
MQHMILTGCPSLDRLLGGGLPSDGISLVYGEAETGKSSLAVQCAVNCARTGLKSIFIDSDDTFSPRRFTQIAHKDYEMISPLIVLIKPSTFRDQMQALDHLEKYMTKRVGLLVVDTITSLYRLELGDAKDTFEINRELNRQIAHLSEVSASCRVATLITSQVRSILTREQEEVEPVATRVLKFWSKVVLSLKPTGQTHIIRANLEKHPTRKKHVSCYLTINRTGIRDCKGDILTKTGG